MTSAHVADKATLEAAIAIASGSSGLHSFMPDAVGIYVMVNRASGGVYIGKSSNLRKRAALHRGQLLAGHDNPGVRKDCEAHGRESFGFAVVAQCDLNCIDAIERAYIRIAACAFLCHNIMLAEEPKTTAERQREFRQRRKAVRHAKTADGLYLYARWIHPDDVPEMEALRVELAKQRAAARI